MIASTDAFKKFQEKLAALDSKSNPQSAKTTPVSRLDYAKADILRLKKRYELTVAEMVAFFPEVDGIGYLQQVITEVQAKASKGKGKS